MSPFEQLKEALDGAYAPFEAWESEEEDGPKIIQIDMEKSNVKCSIDIYFDNLGNIIKIEGY